MSNWINFVKNYAKSHNISYKLALSQASSEYKKQKTGGSLSVEDTQNLLKASYNKNLENQGDFIIDESLSGQRVKVYVNQTTGQVIVAHRGTKGLSDVGTDMGLALGYRGGERYAYADKIQKQAENKYGKENVTTIGHSLGSDIAQQSGGNSKEIITYNKPNLPFEGLKNNQTNIRTSNDPISYLFQPTGTITVKSKTNNPLKEHSIRALDTINKGVILGKGVGELKIQYDIIKGEIEAGNNSVEMKKALKTVSTKLNKLKRNGIVLKI